MLIEQQIKQVHALDHWFASSLGNSVACEFKKQLAPFHTYLQGEHLLQLGCGTHHTWLDDLSFTNKWIAQPAYVPHNDHHTLVCSLDQLPLQRNSVDCVLVPLVLEWFHPDNHLINELDRILKPMGYLIFFCVNPWSFWGAALKSGYLACYDHQPVTPHSSFHLNRLLLQRGYIQCSLTHFYYLPPVRHEALINKLAFFNEVGKMLWPFPSGFYCYVAQKYEPLNPFLTLKPIQTHFIPSLQA